MERFTRVQTNRWGEWTVIATRLGVRDTTPDNEEDGASLWHVRIESPMGVSVEQFKTFTARQTAEGVAIWATNELID